MYRSSHQRCSVKKVFLEISQNAQGNTCARVSLLINFHWYFPGHFAKFLRILFWQNTSGWVLLHEMSCIESRICKDIHILHMLQNCSKFYAKRNSYIDCTFIIFLLRLIYFCCSKKFILNGVSFIPTRLFFLGKMQNLLQIVILQNKTLNKGFLQHWISYRLLINKSASSSSFYHSFVDVER